MRTSGPSGSKVCVQVRPRWIFGFSGSEKFPVMYRGPPCIGVPQVVVMTALCDGWCLRAPAIEVLHGEFDPGSGRTLAACLTHASGATNRGLPRGKAANG